MKQAIVTDVLPGEGVADVSRGCINNGQSPAPTVMASRRFIRVVAALRAYILELYGLSKSTLRLTSNYECRAGSGSGSFENSVGNRRTCASADALFSCR